MNILDHSKSQTLFVNCPTNQRQNIHVDDFGIQRYGGILEKESEGV